MLMSSPGAGRRSGLPRCCRRARPAASETDGLDVISTGLGPAFPNGEDGRNLMPDEPQNFKLVPWEAIARPLGLEVMRGWDPRAVARR